MESVGREPDWHAEHFDLDDHEAERNAEAAEFVEQCSCSAAIRPSWAMSSSLAELPRRRRHARPPLLERLVRRWASAIRGENHFADMDWGFYSADYLLGLDSLGTAPPSPAG